MQKLEVYKRIIESKLKEYAVNREPAALYEPVHYILQLGGKRLRPILTLLVTDLYEGSIDDALNAALAIEIFHNFTLVHDDIMDSAPLRRGQATVHHKWDINTGILSGDAMLILAYHMLNGYDGERFRSLTTLFSKMALEVCEGQQYDIDFETRNDVTIDEYLKMIEYKTAVLVATAMQFGAIIGGASSGDQQSIYSFGINLGIAFQIQDDYLDAFGDPEVFGKKVGGDILENKKTYLYLQAYKLGTSAERSELRDLFGKDEISEDHKIERVKSLFESTGSKEETQKAIAYYTNQAFGQLDNLKMSGQGKAYLRSFGEYLMNRSY